MKKLQFIMLASLLAILSTQYTEAAAPKPTPGPKQGPMLTAKTAPRTYRDALSNKINNTFSRNQKYTSRENGVKTIETTNRTGTLTKTTSPNGKSREFVANEGFTLATPKSKRTAYDALSNKVNNTFSSNQKHTTRDASSGLKIVQTVNNSGAKLKTYQQDGNIQRTSAQGIVTNTQAKGRQTTTKIIPERTAPDGTIIPTHTITILKTDGIPGLRAATTTTKTPVIEGGKVIEGKFEIITTNNRTGKTIKSEFIEPITTNGVVGQKSVVTNGKGEILVESISQNGTTVTTKFNKPQKQDGSTLDISSTKTITDSSGNKQITTNNQKGESVKTIEISADGRRIQESTPAPTLKDGRTMYDAMSNKINNAVSSNQKYTTRDGTLKTVTSVNKSGTTIKTELGQGKIQLELPDGRVQTIQPKQKGIQQITETVPTRTISTLKDGNIINTTIPQHTITIVKTDGIPGLRSATTAITNPVIEGGKVVPGKSVINTSNSSGKIITTETIEVIFDPATKNSARPVKIGSNSTVTNGKGQLLEQTIVENNISTTTKFNKPQNPSKANADSSSIMITTDPHTNTKTTVINNKNGNPVEINVANKDGFIIEKTITNENGSKQTTTFTAPTIQGSATSASLAQANSVSQATTSLNNVTAAPTPPLSRSNSVVSEVAPEVNLEAAPTATAPARQNSLNRQNSTNGESANISSGYEFMNLY